LDWLGLLILLGAGLAMSIVGGNAQGVFSVDGNGTLRVASAAGLVFEQTQSYALTVALTDSGAPEGAAAQLVTTAQVAVAVLPVNFAPVIVGATFTLAENAPAGAAVGSTAAQTNGDNPLNFGNGALVRPLRRPGAGVGLARSRTTGRRAGRTAAAGAASAWRARRCRLRRPSRHRR
jgi:hypothetical protein